MNQRVISEEIIKPSNPTPPHLRYLKASLFDHANTPVFMPQILFYSKRHALATSIILDRLKNSLPITLSVFYPLAGRAQDANYIVCNDKGVPYIQTQVPCARLSEVVHKAGVSFLDTLLPPYGNNSKGNCEILLAIQVNTFACGGIAIGTKMSHAISDAFSFAMFAKTWASIASGESHMCVPRPCFETWKVFPPQENNTSTNQKKSSLDLIENKPVITKWFMFSKANCDALRSRLGLEYTERNRPSSTMVLSSFIWSRIKLACRSGVNNIPHKVFHSINIRPQVMNTLTDSSCYYFGNMVLNAIAEPSHHGHKSLYEGYLTGMEKSIEKIIGESGSFIEKLKNGQENISFMMNHFELETKGKLVSVGFSSLRTVPMYESDFGWGKPVWVTSATLVFKDLVLLIPAGPSSHDTYAFVSLSPDQMTMLEEDHEFLSFVTRSATFVTSKL